ncbi:MAG: hypothetical protein ACK48P_02590, partial [Holosporales bacterium]
EKVINMKARLLLSAGLGFAAGFLLGAVIFTHPHPAVQVPPTGDFPGTGGLESEKTKPAF